MSYTSNTTAQELTTGNVVWMDDVSEAWGALTGTLSYSSGTAAGAAQQLAAQQSQQYSQLAAQQANVSSWAVSGASNIFPYAQGSFTGYSQVYSQPIDIHWPSNPLWPWYDTQLDKSDQDLVRDFKTRHPDFDSYQGEINVILARKPGLRNSPLLMSVMYELAREMRILIDKYTEVEKVEEALDGKAKESTG